VTALLAAVLFTMASVPDTAGGGVRADSGPAVIVVAIPEGANSVMQEALNRLRGEALSVGFEVRFVHADTPNPPAAQLEALAPGLRAAAVVVFGGQADAATAESSGPQLDVWFLDRASGKTSVAHVRVSDEDLDRADVVIAVRAVDFIRARMFDTLAYRLATAKPAPPPADERPPTMQDRAFLAGGLAVVATSSGFAPSLLPCLEVGYQLRTWLRATASAFGLGTRPEMQTDEGTVRIDQRFIGLGLTFTRWHWRRFSPHADLGGGAYRVVAEGLVTPPGFEGHRVVAWSAGVRASLGVSASLSRHLFFDLTAGTLWLMPQPRLYSSGNFVASTGLPSWTATALVGARFQ